MAQTILGPLVLLGGIVLATPQAHAASCNDVGNGPEIGIEVHVGEPYTEQEVNDFTLMQLRQMGIDATRVERWGGCFRAFVRSPGGGQHFEYFNARTLEPVDN